MRIMCGILLAVIGFAGCSTGPGEKKQEGGGPGAALPGVSYARIGPLNATSSQPLIVEYSAGFSPDGLPATYTCRWYVDGVPVPEASENTLEPQHFRKGATVAAELVPTDGAIQGRAFRTEAITIKNSPPVASAVELTPVPAFAGDRVTAVPKAEDRDGDAISFLYQWEVDGKDAPGANGQTFDAPGVKKKSRIAVTAIPFDGEDRGGPVKSYYLTVSNKAPEIVSEPPSGIEGGRYSYQATARDADGDALTYSLVKAPQGMMINPSTGLVSWEAKPAAAGEEVAVKIAVADGDGGTAYQEFSLILTQR